MSKSIYPILLFVVMGILVLAFAMDWITIGGKEVVIEKEDLPDIVEEEPELITDQFQECITKEDCNWDHTKYYNRDCDGEWRCMSSPYPDVKLCSFGCLNNTYCGDEICGNFETEWSCPDCAEDIGYIGSLEI